MDSREGSGPCEQEGGEGVGERTGEGKKRGSSGGARKRAAETDVADSGTSSPIRFDKSHGQREAEGAPQPIGASGCYQVLAPDPHSG